MLEAGTPVLIVHRRLYGDDQVRFFVGNVEEYAVGIAAVAGFTWLRDPHSMGRYIRKRDKRTKIVSLSSGTLFVYVLDTKSRAEDLEFVTKGEDLLILRDGNGFEMDMSERVPT